MAVKRERILGTVLTLVSAAAIGAFGWAWNTNIEVKLLRAEVVSLKQDHREDEEQNRQIKMLWRYQGWLEEGYSYLRWGGSEPSRRPRWD